MPLSEEILAPLDPPRCTPEQRHPGGGAENNEKDRCRPVGGRVAQLAGLYFRVCDPLPDEPCYESGAEYCKHGRTAL